MKSDFTLDWYKNGSFPKVPYDFYKESADNPSREMFIDLYKTILVLCRKFMRTYFNFVKRVCDFKEASLCSLNNRGVILFCSL